MATSTLKKNIKKLRKTKKHPKMKVKKSKKMKLKHRSKTSSGGGRIGNKIKAYGYRVKHKFSKKKKNKPFITENLSNLYKHEPVTRESSGLDMIENPLAKKIHK